MEKLRKYLLCLLITVFLIINVDVSATGDYLSNIDVNQVAQDKIDSIRNTNSNTSLVVRSGKIYYLSLDGNDSNSGLNESNAWKSLNKVNDAVSSGIIVDGDTILLKRGDKYRGYLNIEANDILIGAYGDVSKAKPQILVSPYNGVVDGEWEEVETNIWKYTVGGQNPFTSDVGVIWFFSNNSGSFEYGIKKLTNKNVDESSLNLSDILTSDLEFYHFGHASASSMTGGALYLYSTSNPKDRFDDIEFSIAKNGIKYPNSTNLQVDNITIKYAGNHGIGGGSTANLKVTNCEIGFIGGATHSYSDSNEPRRFGNAIEVYGHISSKNGYEVEDGFVVDNNYIYQVYDAGVTFQLTTNSSSKVEKVTFSNNVIEYCNYNIEYWNTSTSTDEEVQANTYINNFTISNNIMRYAGLGISTLRPDKGLSCIIRSGEHDNTYENRVIGEFKIENNIFDTTNEQMINIRATDEESLPLIKNNKFYSSKDIPFGGYYVIGLKVYYPYVKEKLDRYFPNNEFYYLESDFANKVLNGTTGDVNWELNISNGTLTISGTGEMSDYTLDNLPEWYDYKDFINKIVIGKNVTKLGKYAFYKLSYVEELEINSITLDDLSKSGNSGTNYTFYQTGKEWTGIKLTFGEDVEKIPARLFWPSSDINETPYITSMNFNGTSLKEIGENALRSLSVDNIVIPDGVEKIGNLAFASSNAKIIYLPESLTKLGAWVFSGCTSVQKIVIGPNITKIDERTFDKTHSLEKIVILGDVTYAKSDYASLFSTQSDTIVYGNDTVRALVESYGLGTNTSNIKYADIREYPTLASTIYEEAINQDDASIVNQVSNPPTGETIYLWISIMMFSIIGIVWIREIIRNNSLEKSGF